MQDSSAKRENSSPAGGRRGARRTAPVRPLGRSICAPIVRQSAIPEGSS
jgi:hypothetical protein